MVRQSAWVASACLLLGLLVAPITSPAGAAVAPRKADACRNTWVRASVSAVHSRHGASGTARVFDLAVTDVSKFFCYLVSPASVWMLAGGRAVGPAASTPGFDGAGGLLPTYQGIFTVSAVSARCHSVVKVSAIRVESGDATSVARLASPDRVCAGTPEPTVSRVTFAHPGPCSSTSIRVSAIGWGAGGGRSFWSIAFRNVGPLACTVHGIPSVQALSGTGEPVGFPATLEHAAGHGGPMVLGVRNGVVAFASYSISGPGLVGTAQCGWTRATALAVTLPGYWPVVVALPAGICAKHPSTRVFGVAPPWIGTLPPGV